MTSAIRNLERALLLPWLVAAAGCTGETDLPPDTALPEIAVSALGTEVSAQELALGSAWLSLEKLTFVPCDPSSASVGATDFRVDLFVEPPSSLLTDSSVSDYCRIQATLAPSTANTPSTLEGLSVHVTGALSDDTPFDLASTVSTSLEFVSATPLPVNRLWLGVDFDAWFAGADVAGADVDDDVVTIDAEHNADVLAEFDDATSLALSLYVDADDDGHLTGDEREPVARATTP
jgi:hypothetical protein